MTTEELAHDIADLKQELHGMALDIKTIQVKLAERCDARLDMVNEARSDVHDLKKRVRELEAHETKWDTLISDVAANRSRITSLDRQMAKWGGILIIVQAALTTILVKSFA